MDDATVTSVDSLAGGVRVFHRRCRDVESALQNQILDLQERLRESTEMLQTALGAADTVRESYARENMELHELLLVAQNPGAQRAFAATRRSAAPAAPPPEVPLTAATRPLMNFPSAAGMGSRIRREAPAIARPTLTPEEARRRARPAASAPAPPTTPTPISLETLPSAASEE